MNNGEVFKTSKALCTDNKRTMSQKALPDKNEIRYLNVHEKTARMTELEARFGECVEDWLWRMRWQKKKSVEWIAETAGVSYGSIRNWLDLCGIKRRSFKEVWADPHFRKRVSRKMKQGHKEKWADPYFRKYHSQQRSQRSKEMWRDPAKREQIIQAHRERWKDPQLKARQAERMSRQSKKLWRDKDYRERQLKRLSQMRREMWQNPQRRQRQAQLMSQVSKAWWQSPTSSSESSNCHNHKND